jgi:hypothetical protein
MVVFLLICSAPGNYHTASYSRPQYEHSTMSSYPMHPTSCRPDAAIEYYQYGHPGPYPARPEMYVDHYPMANNVANGRMRGTEELRFVKRSPYIPDEMEVS